MDKREVIVILLAVALFAFSARAFLYHWTNIFGIDSYWFARMSKYVFFYGDVPERDPLYSWSFENAWIDKELSMYLPAWYYRLRFGEYFDVNKWFLALKDLSAGFGVLGSIASGLTVYALLGPFAGLIAGVLAGTNPGYVYRSMAGFYEDDAVGLALLLVGVWLFVEGMRRRKRKWLWYAGASFAWLGVAVAWEAYELVVFTLALFVLLLVGRLVVDELRGRLPLKSHLHGLGLVAVSSLVLWFLWRALAIRTAVNTLETVGYLTTNINGVGAATLLTLGIHPLVAVLMGAFAYYLTLFLMTSERKYLGYSALSLLLALPFYSLSATNGFAMTLVLSDGREVYIGYGEAFKRVGGTVPGVDLYQMVFGSIAPIFTVQVAASFIALFFARERLGRGSIKEALAAAALVLAVGFLAVFYNGYNWLYDLMGGVGGVLEQRTSVIGATVVEERYGYFFWAPKYSVLALFALVATPFLVYRSNRREFLFLLALFGLTLYLGWIKLKTCYYFGAPLGMVAGIVLYDVYERARRNEKLLKAVFVLTVLIMLSSLATGVYHTVGRIPTLLTPEEVREATFLRPIASDWEWLKGPDYLESFAFINTNTDINDPIFNWWGVGHWLTFFTERPVATDNTNRVFKANKFVAEMFLADWNEAYTRIKERNFAYVYWLRDYIYGAGSFAIYAYGFDEGRRVSSQYTFFMTNECTKVAVGNYYNCGDRLNPFFVDADIVENAPPLYYAPLPFELLPKINGELGVYRLENRLVVVSEKMNRSLMFLLWTGGNEYFQPVFVSQNGTVTVFKIK